MMKKTILSILIGLCAACFLCSCALLSSKLKVETEDLNGEEDYSLAVLTEDDICAEDHDSYCVVYGFSPSGEKSFSEEDYWHDADITKANAVTPLSGVALVQVTYGKEDTVTFTVECTRTKGNMRIVLLDENLAIIHDFSITETSSYTVHHAKGKEFEIRVAGESAEFTVTVEREFSSE
ncbi:MAG: hypothetical protein IJY20_04180 [Clostridia bacterium]|nr:hypothetical protein [Clostridia bacterium]